MKTRGFAWTLIIALAASLALVVGLSISNTPTPAPFIPPGTGVDAAGAEGEVVVPVPDAGEGANITVEENPDGVGGFAVSVRSPAWDGDKNLNAGWAYSNGAKHKAWDVGLWTGTPIYSPVSDALVVGTNDGVKNNPYGVNPGSGSPSNWILLCRNVNGRPAVSYWQHLSPGLSVKRGQRLAYRQKMALSGNSGASTGPHLHVAAGYSPRPCNQISQSYATWLRYDYLNNSTEIFAPSKWWAQPPRPAINAAAVIRKCRVNGRAPGVRHVRKALGMTPRPRCNGPVRQQMKRWQRLNKQPRTGILNKAQLRRLGNQTRVFRVR